MKFRLNLLFLFLLVPILSIQAKISPFLKFEDINQSGIPVTALFQDDKERIWVCTLEGMYVYDGIDLHRTKSWASPDLTSCIIRCSYKVDSEQYYIGCENGLYLFNLRSEAFTLIPETSGIDVRVIAKIDNTTLLLGTMSGVIKFNTETKFVEKVNKIPPFPVVAIQFNEEKNLLYISNNDGFIEYDLSSHTYTFIQLPIRGEKTYLIHAMAYDKKQNCLWLGVEKHFFKYDISSGKFKEKPLCSDHTISVITVDSLGNIWVGTDGGICTYTYTDGEGYLSNIFPDVKYVIWAIFEDKKGNIWIGTDGGLSLYKNNPSVHIHRWENMTGSREENRLTCMFKDSRDNYWFGGTNGIGRLASGKKMIDWYKVNGSKYHIQHNRITCIYEDNEGELWVGTNESINRYDYDRESFIHYTIMDSTQTRNTDWCLSITGDENGRLWITSFLGGVFCVNKKNLIATKKNIYLAEENYHQHSVKFALSSDRVQKTVRDKQGNLWVSTNGYGLNKIDFRADSVILFAQGQKERNILSNVISSLFCDADGFIWVGVLGGLQRIDPMTHEIITVKNDCLKSVEIFSITEKGDFLWLTVPDGLFTLHKKTHVLLHLKLKDGRYMCSLSDQETGEIYIGGNNHYISFNPESVVKEITEMQPAILTTLYVNNEPISVGQEYEGNCILNQALSYTDRIVLRHDQNNLVIELTDSRYNKILKTGYEYKLENADRNWSALDVMNNRITYTNLQPGKYNLIIQQGDASGKAVVIRELAIRILRPWYSTVAARIFFMILLLGLFTWIINYFLLRNNLKMERINREKMLEVSSMKMEFLTNMSHELKTPLCLITNSLNKLMETSKNTKDEKLVKTIFQNASRLSSLVCRIIESNAADTSQDEIVLSEFEVVEFSRSVVQVFKEAFEEKGIVIQFKTNVPRLYINADILKLESVLNNLLSNAGKFSDKDDVISLELNYEDSEDTPQLKLTIADTGIGIPSKDIPYVFSRFYQSESNSYKNKEGSGIGLALVKKYIELNKGKIDLDSEVGKGTRITITLPIMNAAIGESPVSEENLSSSSKLKILIVEDNVGIARFLTENLKNMVCTVAHNGQSGYKVAQELQPDIVISDIMMPVMDGIEMCRLLKQNISTAAIPIIMLTAKDDKQTESKAYALGIDTFISKPFDIKQLELRIHQLINNKTLLIRKINQANLLQQVENVGMDIETAEEKFLMKITGIIEEKLSDSDLNVKILSELSGYNTKLIYRRIKGLTGQTAVDYIRSIRLKKAALLLVQQKYTVSEVMYMVGFSNPSYFSKCFSEKYGKTPKLYMESNHDI